MSSKQKYRKKPVVVEAMQWDGTAADATPIIDWILSNDGCANYECVDVDQCTGHGSDAPHTIAIRTLEGTTRAVPGDWVIRGTAGEFYPCKPVIFASVYEGIPVNTLDQPPLWTDEAEPCE